MAGPKKFRPDPDWWTPDVGKRLRWVREQAGLNQTQVGDLLGCSQQAVTDYETAGRDADPYLMVRFCARFHVTMDYIFRADISGCDPVLVVALLQSNPELARMPTDMARYMGTGPASGTASKPV